MTHLTYIPADQFARVWRVDGEPAARAHTFADLARVNTLYAVMNAGSGHLGSSFSSLDIVSWVYLSELGALEGEELTGTYFSSKGHDVPGLYAVLTAAGLLDFDLVHRLRRLGGLPGHPDVGTPGMAVNSGSLGMGISKAKGLLEGDRLLGHRRRVFVMTGDGELQEGQNWEALGGAVNRGLGELTVIVDHNKLQSDTWVSRVSDLGDLEAKFTAFGWAVERVDGHDLTQVGPALSRLGADDRPGVLIADTVKGAGVSFMEEFPADGAFYDHHSGAPSYERYDAARTELLNRVDKRLAALGLPAAERVEVPAPERTAPRGGKLVDAYAEALRRLAREDQRVVALDGDLVLDTGLTEYVQEFPERFIECGIAEQDMVSMAGGLALRGQLPFVHSFASFLSGRPHEQVIVNSTEHTQVVYVGSLAGIIPGGPGHSHQAVTDVASFAVAHDMLVVEPAHPAQVEALLRVVLAEHRGPIYLRLTSPPVELPEWPQEAPSIGTGTFLHQGADATIVTAGPVMLREALAARTLLAEEGTDVGVVSTPWHNRLNETWWSQVLDSAPLLVTLENHTASGALGQFLLARTARAGWNGRCLQVCVEGVPQSGTNDEVLRAHRLDALSLADRVRTELAEPR